MNMRSEQVMMDLILEIAKQDERIRAAIMNGSRTSPSATKDIFQDYDIVYIVTDVMSFVTDKNWIKHFGDILIMQKPDEIDGIWEKSKDKFAYLMLFKDWNRIDLTLLHEVQLSAMHKDSQSILLLDKDNIVGNFDAPSDKDYLPQPPTEKQFNNCCNEFLWVSTYVAKGIWRKELVYAKYMIEHAVREELIKLLTWYAGMKTHFGKPIGNYGKYLEKYLESGIWNKFTKTYVDSDYTHMWDGLFIMCEIFHDIASKIAAHYGFAYDENEYRTLIKYLEEVRIN